MNFEAFHYGFGLQPKVLDCQTFGKPSLKNAALVDPWKLYCVIINSCSDWHSSVTYYFFYIATVCPRKPEISSSVDQFLFTNMTLNTMPLSFTVCIINNHKSISLVQYAKP